MIQKKTVINLILSYLITFMIFNIGGFASTDILLGYIFAGIFLFLCGERPEIRLNRPVLALSLIQTVLYAIYSSGRLGGGMTNKLFTGTYALFTLTGVFALIYISTLMILDNIGDIKGTVLRGKTAADPANGHPDRFPVKTFLICAAVIFICLLPLFIINFPATMTVDSYDQFEQARGIFPYSDHHPWAHTLLIQLLYTVGHAIAGSINGGLAFYTLTQMIVCTLAVSYTVASLAEEGASKPVQVLVTLGYVLYPYNLAYSITIWKDVMFSAAVLVFTVTLWRVVILGVRRAEKTMTRDIVLWLVSGIMMCLLRHNGFYAYIITSVVLIILLIWQNRKASKEEPHIIPGKPFLYMTTVILLVTFIFNGPVQKAFHVQQGDWAHNIPIPLQQIARVISHHGDISPKDMEMLERINTTDYLKNHYEPGGADPAVQWVVYGDSEYYESHKADYLALWIRVGLKNPVAYIEAYIDQTRGYYTTMPPEQTEYYGMLPNGEGLANSSPFPGSVRFRINELYEKIGSTLPVYGILYSPGACLQLLMLGVLITDKKRLIAYLPVCAVMFTILIAVPLCADLRYAYALMICMPALAAITLFKN